MFVGNEALLGIGFDVARPRLIDLVRGNDLLTVSQDAYGTGVASLASVGSPGHTFWVSRLAHVKWKEPVTRENSMLVALRWEAVGPGGRLFPALDADLTLAPAGERASSLRLAGAYRPPPDASRGQLDGENLHRVAAAAVQGFIDRVGAKITRSTATGPARGYPRASSLPPDAEVS